MTRFLLMLVAVIFVSSSLLSTVAAQPKQPRNQPRGKQQTPDEPVLPSDQRLLALHKNFVKDAEKLASEYERDRDWDKAKDVYKEILRLVPKYTAAQNKLEEISQREASAEKATTSVDAAKEWQFSGVTVLEGKPIAIRATGDWTFVLQAKISPDGIPIPEELREFNLGTLIGYIDTGDRENDKPFAIGNGTSFIAEQTGKLYLRMYDSNPKDNEGSLKIEFSGTFKN
jgi:hypothetical protein